MTTDGLCAHSVQPVIVLRDGVLAAAEYDFVSEVARPNANRLKRFCETNRFRRRRRMTSDNDTGRRFRFEEIDRDGQRLLRTERTQHDNEPGPSTRENAISRLVKFQSKRSQTRSGELETFSPKYTGSLFRGWEERGNLIPRGVI